MLPVSLKTIFARFFDAFDQRDRGAGYVLTGLDPTPFAVGSLQVSTAAGVSVTNDRQPRFNNAATYGIGAASATLTRVDLVYISSAGVPSVAVGTPVLVVPAVVAAWP